MTPVKKTDNPGLRILTSLLVVLLLSLSCGGKSEKPSPADPSAPENNSPPNSFNGAPPAPDDPSDATAPSFETFQKVVQPFMTGFGCIQCHAVGHPFHLVKANTEEDERNNYLNTLCSPRLNSYENPNGTFLSNFCQDSGTAKDPGHKHKTATDKQCGDFYAWVSEGQAGTPSTCGN